ncbi:hypothetical protein, partial [Salmonella enterica]|uniref:hypothetical protein n=1 Tax=Salmonella enterica TaxID=28901 RepID=UPI00398C35AB
RRHLRAHGLQLAGTRLSYHGPVWRGTGEATTPAARLRAVYLFETEKRASGIVPPAPIAAPVRIQWQRGASAA